MAYDDHYLWWSRVQQQKTIGMERGMSVPATMNLTEYRQCTSELTTLYPISNLNRGRERLHVTGVLTPGPGVMPLLDKANLVPGRLSMRGAHSLS